MLIRMSQKSRQAAIDEDNRSPIQARDPQPALSSGVTHRRALEPTSLGRSLHQTTPGDPQ